MVTTALSVLKDSAVNPPLNVTARSSAPTNPTVEDVYLDDGTNTASGDKGWRSYNGTVWEDVSAGAGGGGLSTATELTISGGIVTKTQNYHSIDTEGDIASDDLDTINGGTTNDLLYIFANNDARTVVIKNGTGNILTFQSADISLDEDHKIVSFIYDGTNWREVSSGASLPVVDTTSIVEGNVDATKEMRIDVETNVATATTRVLTMPDADVELFKNNLNASVAPTTTDDSASGYAVGSRWIDTTADKEYVCLDATASAAVWTETTGAGGGGIGGSTGATDNAILRADGVGGSTLQNTGITIDDSDAIAGATITTGANSVLVSPAAIKTLSSGAAATGTDKNLIIAAESGTVDDMIELTGLSIGEWAWLRADTGDTITVKHNDAGATVKIHLQGNADLVLDEQQALLLQLVTTNVLSQPLEAGGGGAISSVQADTNYDNTTLDSTTSGTFVDVDATNSQITATLLGGTEAITRISATFRASKVTAGSAFFRMSDGTNHSTEVEVVSTAVLTITLIGTFRGLASGSTIFTLQFRSDDANQARVNPSLQAFNLTELS